MIYKIELTLLAYADLEEILNYISIDLCSLQIALDQLNRIENCIKSLDHMPERFHKYKNYKHGVFDLRTVSIDNYNIFYFVDKNTETVTVTRVLYGKRDIDALL